MYDLLIYLCSVLFNLLDWFDSIILFDTLSLLRLIIIITIFKLIYKFMGWSHVR